jgi:hypothetical protein
MKISDRRKAERAFVERALGNSVICERCGATLATYADACTADLADMCPGFVAIETAKNQWKGLEK